LQKFSVASKMEKGSNRLTKTSVRPARTSPGSHSPSSGAALAALELYGNGIGRTGHSHLYSATLQKCLRRAPKGNVEADALLQLISAGQLAGLDGVGLDDFAKKLE
jgi:hypothetical protein